MFFPGTRRRTPHVPHFVVPFGLAVCAIFFTLLGWALFAPSHLGSDSVPARSSSVANIGSIAYTVPGPQFDDIVVRPTSGIGLPRVVASLPNSGPTNFHAHGAASPQGERLAVLWLPPFSTMANLAIIDILAGETGHVEGTFDTLSPVAWSPDGSRVSLTSTTFSGGAETTSVVEVNPDTLTSMPVAEFAGALEVAPIGYSIDAARLFIVVVDQKGSNLYAHRAGKTELVAELSPGRTRDWALSPDGVRLGFVDILGGASRTHIGRTLLIATGAITTLPAEGNHLGTSWVPGSPIPVFGGPGGDFQLTDPAAEDAFIVPVAWSPDGAFLVATISAPAGGGVTAPPAIELISLETATADSVRVRISGERGAAFFGFVQDLN